jgi:hypothetical protein
MDLSYVSTNVQSTGDQEVHKFILFIKTNDIML